MLILPTVLGYIYLGFCGLQPSQPRLLNVVRLGIAHLTPHLRLVCNMHLIAASMRISIVQ